MIISDMTANTNEELSVLCTKNAEHMNEFTKDITEYISKH